MTTTNKAAAPSKGAPNSAADAPKSARNAPKSAKGAPKPAPRAGAAKSASRPAGGAKSSPKEGAAGTAVKRFRVLVERREGGEVCSISVPFDVEKTFGARGRVPVRGTLNGAPFRGSLFRMGGGGHFMVVNRKLRDAAGVRGGETVTVTMERDTEPRVVVPPADFARALRSNEQALAAWDRLSFTHRREHVEHVEGAKRPETRQRRIEKSVELLASGRREPR